MILTIEQVRELVAARFGDLGDEAVDTMTAICMAESGGDTEAVGDNYPRWQAADSPYRWDRGLAQINSVHGYDPARLMEAGYNLAAARRIYDQQGFEAWSTYTSGAYRHFLPVPHPQVKEEPPIFTNDPSNERELDQGERIAFVNKYAAAIAAGSTTRVYVDESDPYNLRIRIVTERK